MKNIIAQKVQGHKLFRSKATGRFVRASSYSRKIIKPAGSSIRNGSLYSYRGQTVRALSVCSNGLRLVSSHGVLFGFVSDRDLVKISIADVNNYLDL